MTKSKDPNPCLPAGRKSKAQNPNYLNFDIWILDLLNYIFSVTLYSNLFPNSSLVCASRAGSALRKKETTGRSTH